MSDDLPFFHPKTMSDDMLLEKLNELNAKISWASRSGAGYPVGQMNQMVLAIRAVMAERAFMQTWKRVEQSILEVNETDPDLKAEADGLKPQEPVKVRPRLSARRPTPIITKTPVLPKKEDDTDE